MNAITISDVSRQFSGAEWPLIESMDFVANQCTLAVLIHSDIRWFAGHFPEQPVLPGVVQAHWAASIGRYLFGVQTDFSRLDNLKFQTMIIPTVELLLVLQYRPEKFAVKFAYQRNETVYSEGTAVFAPR